MHQVRKDPIYCVVNSPGLIVALSIKGYYYTKPIQVQSLGINQTLFEPFCPHLKGYFTAALKVETQTTSGHGCP